MGKCLISDPNLSGDIDKKINAIAECLLNQQHMIRDINLLGGKAGLTLFWAYYSRYSNSIKVEKILVPLILEVFQGIKKNNISPTFGTGLAGIGWTIEHLSKNGFLKLDTNSLIGNFDELLYSCMLQYIRVRNYDYFHGALGIGVYFLNRTSCKKSNRYISNLVDELEKISTIFPYGIAWESNTSIDDEGCFNLSLSHGLASIISILTRVYRANINSEKTRSLISNAIDYLIHFKRDTYDSGYIFPAFVSKIGIHDNSKGRLSWCYYDLGISVALWNAGQTFNNESWKQEAVNTLLSTTNIQDINKAGVMDAGLCHGATGIAHIYNRVYNYTGIENFKNSAIYWFQQSLKMDGFKDGLVGYKTCRPLELGGLQNDYSFIEGIAGIGLAMISAVSDMNPAWDSVLILS
jgi:lantibiotic biosynthesis protein